MWQESPGLQDSTRHHSSLSLHRVHCFSTHPQLCYLSSLSSAQLNTDWWSLTGLVTSKFLNLTANWQFLLRIRGTSPWFFWDLQLQDFTGYTSSPSFQTSTWASVPSSASSKSTGPTQDLKGPSEPSRPTTPTLTTLKTQIF